MSRVASPEYRKRALNRKERKEIRKGRKERTVPSCEYRAQNQVLQARSSKHRHNSMLRAVGLPSRARHHSEGFPVQSEVLVSFRLEMDVRGVQFLAITEKQVAARFQVQMQALHECKTLRTREVRQNVHAEDAVEAAKVCGTRQVHLRERDQVPQPRLGETVLSDFRDIVLHQAAGKGGECRM